MISKKAIEKAIEGGWKPHGIIGDIQDGSYWQMHPKDKRIPEALVSWEKFALTPSFWQALGKALGWDDVSRELTPHIFPTGRKTEWWEVQAHRFYDLILTSVGSDCNDRKCGKCGHCKLAAYWNELLGV